MGEPILFSIIIPTYNRADKIPKTITSLLAQSWKNFEIIVVDDGSTDNTKDIIQSFNDPRIKYFWKENAERGAARNYGVVRASGNYVNYFDSDDLAYPNHLQKAAELINRHDFPELFHLGYDHRAEDGKLLRRMNKFDGNLVNYAVKTKHISPISFFIRKDIALQFPFSENREFVMGEDAFHLCQLVARYKLYFDNTITSSLIQHDARSMSTSDESIYLYCKDHITEALRHDAVFMKVYGEYVPAIGNEYIYMIWLNCLMNHDNKKAWKYFKIYTKAGDRNILSRRTLVFFKKYVYNLFA